jgi:outer membrane protein assembly factor BamD (BamD/ComL family)
VVRDEPPPPPPSPRQAQPTAEDRYRDAEAALAAGKVTDAERLLGSLVADFPTSPLVDQALYERARLAYTRHAWDQARRALDALAAHAGSPLAEPGRYLACRVAVEAHDGDAARCIVDYRATYPQSPHDLDLLATLVQLQYAAGGCTAASAAIAELVAHAPSSKLVDAWVARCPASASP